VVVIARALVLGTAIVAAGAYANRAGGYDAPVARATLGSLPRTLGAWTAVAETPLDADAREVLRVDDYVNRTYAGPGERRVNLYVGYWASQRQGDTIHSPQNCLPGSGWQPVESSRTTLVVNGRRIPITRYLIERGGERQLAYYWFQGRGRVTANEYANKFWLVVDAARLHRSDGAIVRVMAPLRPSEGAEPAAASLGAFAGALFPGLERYLP
jgi:EpsI family protein